MPLSIWAGGSANCPEWARITPILIACWACADVTARTAAAIVANPTRAFRIVVFPCGVQDLPHVQTAGDSHAAAPAPRAAAAATACELRNRNPSRRARASDP